MNRRDMLLQLAGLALALPTAKHFLPPQGGWPRLGRRVGPDDVISMTYDGQVVQYFIDGEPVRAVTPDGAERHYVWVLQDGMARPEVLTVTRHDGSYYYDQTGVALFENGEILLGAVHV
jgi:hypothetical protein